MANPFEVAPVDLSGLGAITQAYGQKRQQDQMMEQKKAGASNAMKFLNKANMTDDKIEKEQLFMMAYDASPEFTKGLLDNIKTRGEGTKLGAETLGEEANTLLTGAKTLRTKAETTKIYAERDKIRQEIEQIRSGGGMTPYQAKTLDLREKDLDVQETKYKLMQENNKSKRKSLQNKLRKDEIELAKLEREEAAALKGGEAEKLLRDASEGSRNSATFANRMIASNSQIDELEKTIDPTSRVIGIISGGGGITSELANRLASSEEQQYASAASDFVTAQLRKESGAVIGDDEFERKYREFFPVPGDTTDQIEKKKIRRSMAAEDMSISSGGLYDALYGESSSGSANNGSPKIGTDGGNSFTSQSGISFTVE